MILKQFSFVLIAVLALAFSTYGYIEPEIAYIPEPAEVIAYTYTDSYWDITPNSQSTSYMTDESGNTLPAYENGTLNFYGSVTSDYNPWAQTQCQWNQNMMLLDLTIGQLLNANSISNLGTTWMGGWSFGSGGEVAIELSATVGISNCGPTMPQMPPGGVGGTIIDGISGTSHSRYIYIFSPIPNPVYYKYRHNTSHSRETCPARCALKIPENVIFAALGTAYPGHEIDLELPFDKNGICAVAYVYRDDPDVRCRNTYDLPF